MSQEWITDQIVFPAAIDKFLSVYDNINPSYRNIDEIIFGEHYNKLAAAVNMLQSMIVFVPSSEWVSGSCGNPFQQTPVCPGRKTTGPGGTSGDNTLRNLSRPYVISMSLSGLINAVCPNIVRTQVTSGGVIPFEIVVTQNLAVDYSECPEYGRTIIQDKTLFNTIRGSKNVMVSARAALYPDWNDDAFTIYSGSRPVSYLNDIVVNCFSAIKPNFLFIRGYVIDMRYAAAVPENLTGGMWRQWTGNTFGGDIQIEFSIVKIN
jgi:hypothetical protein